MHISRLISFLIFTAIAVPSVASAEPVAVVNGAAIDKKTMDQIVSAIVQSSNGQAQDTPALRNEVKTRLINREVILQEAKRLKLDKNADVTRRLEEDRNEILRNALFATILQQSPITDAQIDAGYKELVNKLKGQKEIHAYQIVVSDHKQALELIAELKKGAKFDSLVKTRSLDPNAKQTGGDMGWGNLSTMEPPLAEALKTIKKNHYTQQPFQSSLGWHIFKVEDIRDAQIPPLDQVKEQITRQLQEEKIAKVVGELRAKAKIQ